MFRFWGGLLLIFNDDDSTNNTVHESENVKRRNGKPLRYSGPEQGRGTSRLCTRFD